MRVGVAGGGPGGLYFAISMKQRMPETEIVVFERNSPDATFGWGVVFSGRTLEVLAANDAESAQRLSQEFVHWDAIETILEDASVTKNGYPFYGIDRRTLLRLLAERCVELGVDVRYGQEMLPDDELTDSFDLVVAADGVNSRFRTDYASELGATENYGSNRYIWLGTKAVFDKFRFIFKKAGSHWFWAHAYPFDGETSTFIVECSQPAWEENGFRNFDTTRGCERIAELFADVLDGQALLVNGVQMRSSHWDRFRRVECRKWSIDNRVLIGDAAHTIHFSVGSGTKQAFDDAICLANALEDNDSIRDAIDVYQRRRIEELRKLKKKGENSMRWFEDAAAYAENLGVGDFERALLHRATCSAHRDAEEHARAS